MAYHGMDGRTVYELERVIRSGGEGIVHSIQGRPRSVAKIYKPDRIADAQLRKRTRDKILAMIGMRFTPHVGNRLVVAWPEDALFDSHGEFQGFVMPQIRDMKSLIWASRPADRDVLWPQGYRWSYSMAIAYNLALTIEYLHKAGIVVGDMNTNNILINAQGMVTLIDADSFNITSNGQVYKCIVGFPEVLPPELQGKDLRKPTSAFSEKTDCFSLAIHIFCILCNNCHPFGCLDYNKAHGSSSMPQIQGNIAKGYCPYVGSGGGRTVDDALDMDVFPADLRRLFERAFRYDAVTAVRQATIGNRPSAAEWRTALGNLYHYLYQSSGVTTCRFDPLHEYPKYYSKGCPWCAIEQRKNIASVPPIAMHQMRPRPGAPTTSTSSKSNPVRKPNSAKAFWGGVLVLSILYSLMPASYKEAVKESLKIGNGRSEQHAPTDYDRAIHSYRNRRYGDAYTLLKDTENSYRQTRLYKALCLAHLNGPSGYFSTIYNNINFEDAKALLTYDDDMFCRYMKGAWKYNGANGIKRVVMTDNGGGSFTLTDMPEMPNGGHFKIQNGMCQYQHEGSAKWTDLYRIEISDMQSFMLHSLWSGDSYYFAKE